MTTDVALEIRDLQASYGQSQVLHGTSLACRQGEITCLLGRNGVGKSTTLKSIMGLIRPGGGSIRYRGRDIAGLPAHRVARLGLGYVPEERLIFPTLTVTENLLLGCRPGTARGGWSVKDVLERFPGLARRKDSKGRFLSGGEQQMLAIGRAMVANPGVMLIDDPSEGLAPVIVEVVEQVIREIAGRGVAVLLVESKLPVVERLATRVNVMSKGEVVYEGTVAELKENHAVRKQYLEV